MMANLLEITGKPLSGEWGNDDNNGNGIPVLRTTNFTNEGVINYKNVVTRDVGQKDISQKYLQPGDIIIEKSGGSDKQPVGRVVYFDGEPNKYLFNNFTGVLRVRDTKEWHPRYIFYALYANYIKGGTRRYENKTTGLHNLKIDQYVQNFGVEELALEYQYEIVAKLDKIGELIVLRKEQLIKLDQLVKSRFIELFGLPVSNSKGWNTEKMREVAPAVNYSGDFEDAVWLLNLDMVEAQTGRILDYLYVNEEEVGNSTCTFDTTNVLYSKLRPYLNKVVIPDRCGYATSELIPLKPNPMKLERTYLAFMLRSDEFVNMINEKVAGAKMPRVSMSDFREFDVPVPPMELQKQFATFVEQTDKSKLAVQQSIAALEELKKSLMQKYFG
jgi:type I restriction enzyme S subunit